MKPIVISHHRTKVRNRIKQEIRKRDPTGKRVYIDDLYFKSHYQYAQIKQWLESRREHNKKPHSWISVYVLMLESYTYTKWTMENNARLKQIVRESYGSTTNAFLQFIVYLDKEGL